MLGTGPTSSISWGAKGRERVQGGRWAIPPPPFLDTLIPRLHPTMSPRISSQGPPGEASGSQLTPCVTFSLSERQVVKQVHHPLAFQTVPT